MIIKTCKKHGELSENDIIKSGISKRGQRHRCRKCMKDLHRNHYLRNKEKILQARKIDIVNNPELEGKIRYIIKDKKKLQQQKNESKRRLYALNPDKYRKERQERDNRNPFRKRLRQQRYQQKNIMIPTDQYAKHLLTRDTPLRYKDIPQSLVNLKKALIKLKRELKKNERFT